MLRTTSNIWHSHTNTHFCNQMSFSCVYAFCVLVLFVWINSHELNLCYAFHSTFLSFACRVSVSAFVAGCEHFPRNMIFNGFAFYLPTCHVKISHYNVLYEQTCAYTCMQCARARANTFYSGSRRAWWSRRRSPMSLRLTLNKIKSNASHIRTVCGACARIVYILWVFGVIEWHAERTKVVQNNNMHGIACEKVKYQQAKSNAKQLCAENASLMRTATGRNAFSNYNSGR